MPSEIPTNRRQNSGGWSVADTDHIWSPGSSYGQAWCRRCNTLEGNHPLVCPASPGAAGRYEGTGWLPDRWEMMARNAAHALPTMRHASTRAIQDAARMLREAYEIGRAEAYVAGYVAGSTERDKKLPEGDQAGGLSEKTWIGIGV